VVTNPKSLKRPLSDYKEDEEFPVKVVFGTDTLTVMLEGSETIKYLKSKIFEKFNIEANNQRLLSNGRLLDKEDTSVSDYYITKHSVIRVLLNKHVSKTLTLKLKYNNILTDIEVDAMTTVLNVKKLFRKMNLTPPNNDIILQYDFGFLGPEDLEDVRALSVYNIKNGAILTVTLQPHREEREIQPIPHTIMFDFLDDRETEDDKESMFEIKPTVTDDTEYDRETEDAKESMFEIKPTVTEETEDETVDDRDTEEFKESMFEIKPTVTDDTEDDRDTEDFNESMFEIKPTVTEETEDETVDDRDTEEFKESMFEIKPTVTDDTEAATDNNNRMLFEDILTGSEAESANSLLLASIEPTLEDFFDDEEDSIVLNRERFRPNPLELSTDMTLNIKSMMSAPFKLEFEHLKHDRVSDLKNLIGIQTGLDASLQSLLFKSKVLLDDQIIDELGIRDGSLINLVLNLRSGFSLI
jgi:hypothetical protein